MKKELEVTVLIIDEHSDVSPTLARRLDKLPGIKVIGETANVMLGAELAHQFHPNIILADFRRTGPPRAETYRWLGRVSPDSKLVAHLSYVGDGETQMLTEAGVDSCLLKGASVARLSEQLRSLAGETSDLGRPLNGHTP
jgi:DNA-binding NarL/FixJ family response regulator